MEKETQKEIVLGRCTDFSVLQVQISLENIPSDVLMKRSVAGRQADY